MITSKSQSKNAAVGPLRRKIAIALLVVLLPVIAVIMFGGIHFFKVPSRSMVPTLYPSDFIIAQPANAYTRGDIVVFKDPDFDNEFLVKRIVGVGGDTLSVRGGAVFLKGSYLSEPYRHQPIEYDMEPYQVPEDHYFLLGDNANVSIDSHNWGASTEPGEDAEKGSPRSIPSDLIIGKVTYLYLPISRSGKLKPFPLRNILAE